MILNNLFNQAATIIPTQCGTIERFVSRDTNEIGNWVDVYDAPVKICGSFQAVPRSLFANMGLDYKKTYYMLFTSDDISGLARDESGDKVLFAGMTLKTQKEGGWKAIDGWSGLLLVRIPDEVAP